MSWSAALGHCQIRQRPLFEHGQVGVTHLGHQPIQAAHGLVAIVAALVKMQADAGKGRDGAVEDSDDLRKRVSSGCFNK